MAAELNVWVVYDHPLDQPEFFVARRWVAGAGVNEATEDTILARSIHELRSILLHRFPGLYCLQRQPGDDPVILETWL